MTNTKLLIFFLFLFLGLVLSSILIENNLINDSIIKDSISIPYPTESWNRQIHVSFWKNTAVSFKFEIQGPFIISLTTHSLHRSSKIILINTTQQSITQLLNGTRLFYSFHMHYNTANNLLMRLTFLPPLIDENNLTQYDLFTKQAHIYYHIHVISNPLPSLGFQILMELGIFGVFLLVYFLTPKNARLIPSINQGLQQLRLQKPKSASSSLFINQYFIPMLPDAYLIGLTSFSFIIWNNLAIGKEFLTMPSTNLELLRLLLNASSYAIIFLYTFLPAIIVLFGFDYLSKEYEHFWTYPNSKKRLFFHVSFSLLLIWGSIMITYALFVAIIYALLLGDLFFDSIFLFWIGGIIIHLMLMLFIGNIILIIQNNTSSWNKTVSFSFLFLSVLTFFGKWIYGLSHKFYFLMWQQQVFPVYAVLILISCLLLSYIILYFSFEQIEVYNE